MKPNISFRQLSLGCIYAMLLAGHQGVQANLTTKPTFVILLFANKTKFFPPVFESWFSKG